MTAMIGGSPAANGSNAAQYSATTCGHNAETSNPAGPIMTLCSYTSFDCWRGVRSTHHQHRNAGVIQDLLRLASEHELCDTTSTMRRHHNQVAPGLLGRHDDGFVGPVAPLRDGVALDPSELRLALQRGEQLFRVGLRECLQF